MGVSVSLGCQIQLGCGGKYIATFGQELLYGSSLADIKLKIQKRWNKSIGKSYLISYVNPDGDSVVETYVPKLVKVRTLTRRGKNLLGQLDFNFD
jgi:hypothetical protein